MNQQAGKNSPKIARSYTLGMPVLSFILAMTMVICVYCIANHFLERWDGHFHDAKGCTTLQSSNSKLFKVNSCNGDVEEIEITPDMQRNLLPPFNNPGYDGRPQQQQQMNPQQMPQMQQMPPKKPQQQPKDLNAPKLNPYMI